MKKLLCLFGLHKWEDKDAFETELSRVLEHECSVCGKVRTRNVWKSDADRIIEAIEKDKS